MANPEHLEILKQGVEGWNRWRVENWDVPPDLNGADLSRADLSRTDLREVRLIEADLRGAYLIEADLRGAYLSEAILSGADLRRADLREASLNGAHLRRTDLSWADLSGAHLRGADLSGADLIEADLRGADLRRADLSRADLSGADLEGANLSHVSLVETKLTGGANLTSCRIYGVSAWGLQVDETAKQTDLIITRYDEPVVTVDNLEVAQFVYLLLHNEKIRDVIDTITSKVVLILGRFSAERKAVLDAIREELRHRNFTPVLFDFDKPAGKDVTGTVETLARMARFIIADLTDPSSIPHELATVVPFLRTTPVLLLRLEGAGGYSMAQDLEAYPWVLEPYEYTDGPSLIRSLPKVIAPAEQKADELRGSDGG